MPVIQVMLGQLGLVSSEMMFSQWRYVVVGATVAAAVLTPSTDPFTQTLLAVPLVGLYMGGAYAVKVGGVAEGRGGGVVQRLGRARGRVGGGLAGKAKAKAGPHLPMHSCCGRRWGTEVSRSVGDGT